MKLSKQLLPGRNDEDLKQEIALKLLEEIPNFPLEEAERIAGGETD